MGLSDEIPDSTFVPQARKGSWNGEPLSRL